MEVDGVAKSDYIKVVDQRYLCDVMLHDQVPLRAAAPVECRFSALDAALERLAETRSESGSPVIFSGGFKGC